MSDAAPARLLPIFGTTPRRPAMTEPERLVYRSNILGSDKRVTNYGGGNTSSKIDGRRIRSPARRVEVLWVKGSGGDSASIKLDGFSTLYMDKLRALKRSLSRRRSSRTRWWATCPTRRST